jgi:hypothetical protein
LKARACKCGARDGAMERRREESGPSARKAGDAPRTPRRSESAEDGEEEEAEARDVVRDPAVGRNGRRERRGSERDGG